jgi:uncharacterized protein (DUF983 family)
MCWPNIAGGFFSHDAAPRRVALQCACLSRMSGTRWSSQKSMPDRVETPPNPILAGLTCRCPRCGKGKMFSGFLGLKPICEVCGLDYSFADAGDGPAVFVIMISGAIVVAAALFVEVQYSPPLWVHALLWVPLILVTSLVPLRCLKGVLIALQYHHKAAEGRLEPGGEP